MSGWRRPRTAVGVAVLLAAAVALLLTRSPSGPAEGHAGSLPAARQTSGPDGPASPTEPGPPSSSPAESWTVSTSPSHDAGAGGAQPSGVITAAAPNPTASVPATAVPGGAGIEVAPGVRGAPGLDAAVQALGRYFDAINQHDQAGWAESLVPGPGRATDSQWAGLQTTQDSDVVITAVDPLSEGQLQVSVRYVSRQAPSAGYGHACLRWQEAFILARYQGQLRISTVDDSALSRRPC